MAKRLHIATLGIHHNILVEYVITKRGADKVAIIYTKENEEELVRIREEIEGNLVEVVSRKVPAWDYHEVLSGILEVVSDHEEYEIEYNISCGTRVMTSAAYLAALFTDSPVFVVENANDQIGDIIEIQPFSAALLSEPKKLILRRLDEAGGYVDSQRELGSRTDLRASSISKHLSQLENAGYVVRENRGRITKVTITNLGLIVLNLKAYRKGKVWG